jgi:uncharacterized protein YneF (UPF0154 family)
MVGAIAGVFVGFIISIKATAKTVHKTILL